MRELRASAWVMGLLLSTLCLRCAESDTSTAEGQTMAYEVYTTTGGDSTFKFGTLGAINKGLLGLFDRITDSSEVHIAMFNWTMMEPARRLTEQLRAHKGAQAAIVMDPRHYSARFPPHRKKLNQHLQSFADASEQLRLMNALNPQVGLLNVAEPSSRRRMHNKFFLFRNLAPTDQDNGRWTVAVSSANLTYSEVGESNEMLVIHGDRGLYERFRDYWEAMSIAMPEYSYKTTHTYSNLHDHRAFFFPKAVEGDVVDAELAALEEGLKTARKPGKVRIAMSIWHRCRKAIAARLLRLQQTYELDVRVLLKRDPDIAFEVYDLLQQLPAGSVRWLPSRHPELHYGLHSKLMLIDGPFPLVTDGEATRQRLVYTGSHNWNWDAHRFNSETLIRVANADVYEQLEAHWDELWEKGVDSTDMYAEMTYDSTDCE